MGANAELSKNSELLRRLASTTPKAQTWNGVYLPNPIDENLNIGMPHGRICKIRVYKTEDYKQLTSQGEGAKKESAVLPVVEKRQHIVAKGDTFSSLTRKYKTELQAAGFWQDGDNLRNVVRRFAQYNNSMPTTPLRVGSEIKIPKSKNSLSHDTQNAPSSDSRVAGNKTVDGATPKYTEKTVMYLERPYGAKLSKPLLDYYLDGKSAADKMASIVDDRGFIGFTDGHITQYRGGVMVLQGLMSEKGLFDFKHPDAVLGAMSPYMMKCIEEFKTTFRQTKGEKIVPPMMAGEQTLKKMGLDVKKILKYGGEKDLNLYCKYYVGKAVNDFQKARGISETPVTVTEEGTVKAWQASWDAMQGRLYQFDKIKVGAADVDEVRII